MLVAGGATNVTTYFAMRLTADGTAATGLTITNFDLQYVRSGAAPSAKVDATALAATDSAHGDNQAIEIDATDAPGLYRVDWPDAAFAAGVREVILTVKVATCFTEHLRVEIDGEVNVVEWAGTDVVAGAIPAFAADAAGGLPISDAGGLDLDAKIGALTFTVANQVDANMLAISGDATAADNLEESATAIVSSTAKAGTLSTTQMSTNLTEATDDHYIGRTVIWTSGVLAGQASDITDYVGTNGVLTYSALTDAPSATDAFVIV